MTGLRVWDANGVLTIDSSTNVFNYLGRINIGGDSANNGNYSDAALAPVAAGQGRFCYFLILTGNQSSPLNTPSVTCSGTTISWNWPKNDVGGNDQFLLIYGMY